MLIHILILNILLLPVELLGAPALSESPAFYEKIVACKGHNQTAIYAGIAAYFKDQAALSDKDSATLFISHDKLRIYSQILGNLKKPVGEVTFDVRVDVKDEKFRLTIHDPWFTPLERDRYSKLVMSDDKAEQVEEENFKHRMSLFKKIEKQLQAYIDGAGQSIRERVINDELNITNW
ncbi:DUF4468 domain-containing protein [Fulvivirga sp. 29W222]|uniref:DUF4468 domain-containing protein n=1 Tax=Fulvivirga marina TaxID=2494733 RepID=A0A937FTM5_9BACT|nr:DUF4468 domain-containing protein [Fulvivirga marina]MBL6445479.1 DUF4468 domain-containing protein [Fulvivirga marina]